MGVRVGAVGLFGLEVIEIPCRGGLVSLMKPVSLLYRFWLFGAGRDRTGGQRTMCIQRRRRADLLLALSRRRGGLLQGSTPAPIRPVRSLKQMIKVSLFPPSTLSSQKPEYRERRRSKEEWADSTRSHFPPDFPDRGVPASH